MREERRQGHGRTPDIDRPLDIRLMADDIAALIDHLGSGRLMSWDIRSVAEWPSSLAVQHPSKVRKLVMVSGERPARRDSG